MGRTRVLVADDNMVFGSLLSRFVSSQPDMEIVGMAADGGEALRLAAMFSPDVVLMDLCMPGLDGFAATRILSNTRDTVKVIALSAHRSADTEDRIFEAGACAFLRKTEVGGELLGLIRGLTAAQTGTPDLAVDGTTTPEPPPN